MKVGVRFCEDSSESSSWAEDKLELNWKLEIMEKFQISCFQCVPDSGEVLNNSIKRSALVCEIKGPQRSLIWLGKCVHSSPSIKG